MWAYINKIFGQHRGLLSAVLVTCVLYARFFSFGHISWDDPEMVFKNKAVMTFDVPALFSNHYVGNYIPVTMLLHAINWLLFGDADWAHHSANILFHVMNGLLVYRLGQQLFRNSPSIATLGAILFLLHPIQVESVGWISELKNVAAGTFFLLTLLCYLSYKENNKPLIYLACIGLFTLGCMSKSSVVVLPLILIAIDFFTNPGFSTRSFYNKIPFLLIALIFGIINLNTQAADLFINHAHEFPFYQRAGLAGWALGRYLLLFLFPIKLSVIYPYPEINTMNLVLGGLVWLGLVTAAVWLIRQKKKTWVFLLAFVLLNLILVLQFLPFGEVLYADRYLYLPIIGLGWMLGVLFTKTRLPAGGIAVTVMCVTGLFTLSRIGNWQSAIQLYEDILKKYPGQFVALNSAGVESMFLNRDADALRYLDEAIKAAPNNYKGYYNRGLLFIKNNKPKQAIASFNKALAIYDYPKAYIGRATAYLMSGDLPKAMNDASYILTTNGNNPKAHFVLGNCYNELNRLDEAMKEYNKCIELNGDEADYYFKRAVVYGKKRDFRSCLNDLNLCLSLNNRIIEAYYWRGVAKVNLKESPCNDFRIASQNNYEPGVMAYYRYCK